MQNKQIEQRAYQLDAINFLINRMTTTNITCGSAFLFLPPGYGKTGIIIRTFLSLLQKNPTIKCLLISPINTIDSSWRDEINLFDTNKKINYTNIKSIENINNHNYNFIAINPEYLQSAEQKNIIQSIIKQKFNFLIIDELTFFKNSQSKRFKILRKYTKYFKYKIGMTGTPTANDLIDLWAQFYIIDNGYTLGKLKTQFKFNYFYPEPRGFGWIPKSYAEKEIFDKIKQSNLVYAPQSNTILQKESNFKEPTLNINIVSTTLQKNDKLFEIEKIMIQKRVIGNLILHNKASVTNKIRQLTSGFYYDENEQPIYIYDTQTTEKLKLLEQILLSTKLKTLIPVYWKEDFEILKSFFENNENFHSKNIIYLNNDKHKKNLKKIIDEWNANNIDILIFNPKTLGYGSNMQKSKAQIIWFTLTYSFELFKQTNARLARNGYPGDVVDCYILMIKDTIDEHVYNTVLSKQKTHIKLFEILDDYINTKKDEHNKQFSLQF